MWFGGEEICPLMEGDLQFLTISLEIVLQLSLSRFWLWDLMIHIHHCSHSVQKKSQWHVLVKKMEIASSILLSDNDLSEWIPRSSLHMTTLLYSWSSVRFGMFPFCFKLDSSFSFSKAKSYCMECWTTLYWFLQLGPIDKAHGCYWYCVAVKTFLIYFHSLASFSYVSFF